MFYDFDGAGDVYPTNCRQRGGKLKNGLITQNKHKHPQHDYGTIEHEILQRNLYARFQVDPSMILKHQ